MICLLFLFIVIIISTMHLLQFYCLIIFGFIKESFAFDDNIDNCLINSTEAISAYNRASTFECKNEIKRISCQLQHGVLFNYTHISKRYCPSANDYGYFGCIYDEHKNKLLSNLNSNNSVVFNDTQSKEFCTLKCVSFNFKHAIFESITSNCTCFNLAILKSDFIHSKCEGENYVEVYQTGIKGNVF